mmetsp:Transcript_15234/g.22806  ORF Transcript_15234/g.22806 Transcript_15234/m.22806 type:complete len:201 (-) Transcript_15234:291-893(-)
MNALRQTISSQMIRNRRGILQSMALSTALSATTATYTTSIALCESKDDDDDILSKIKTAISENVNLSGIDMDNLNMDAIGQTIGTKIQDAITTGVPTQISYGFVCGFSSGYALKKVGKIASVVFGLGFATLQSLAYAGYIEINHNQLKMDVEKVMDLNRDGKVDGDDANIAMDKVMKVLQFNMVGGSGFAAGFLGGVKSG